MYYLLLQCTHNRRILFYCLLHLTFDMILLLGSKLIFLATAQEENKEKKTNKVKPPKWHRKTKKKENKSITDNFFHPRINCC